METTRAGRREWLGLAVLALPILLLSLDLSVLYLALPQLSADLAASSVEQLWIVDIYGFMVAGFLVTMGTLGDRIGRRRLLMVGAAAFGLASIVAAFSTSPEMLIATRALLGIAGATLAPCTLALVSTMFKNPKQQAVAISAIVSCFMGGSALGPVVGGVMLEYFWWGSVFLLGVPVMALLLGTGRALLPEFRTGAGRLDVVSVALSLAALLPTIYGLKELAKSGVELVAVAALAAGIAFGVAFVRRQRRLADPLLDVSLFGNRTFSSAIGIWVLGGVFLGGATLLITQYLQLVAALSPLHAGLVLLPSILAMVAGSVAAPHLAKRFRPAYVIGFGLVTAAAGFVVLTQVHSDGPLAVLVVGWAIALFGNGLPAGLGVALVVGTAPPEKAGSASAVSQTGMELGLALGIAVIGSISAVVYRNQIAGAIPADLPGGAAAAVGDSLNGALVTAGHLPELIASARAAYAAGLNFAAGLSAVLFTALAVLAIAALRHVPAFGAAAAEPTAEPTTLEPTTTETAATEAVTTETTPAQTAPAESEEELATATH